MCTEVNILRYHILWNGLTVASFFDVFMRDTCIKIMHNDFPEDVKLILPKDD